MKLNTQNLPNTALCTPDGKWVIYDKEGRTIDSGNDINAYCANLFEVYCCHNDVGEVTNQFSDGRYAVALTPGKYELDIHIGYYTSVIGMGQKPEDVVVNGKIQVPNSCYGNALDNFWRSCEGVSINVSDDGLNYWRVSQAAPFRRNVINGSLVLGESTAHETGYASGGFLGECRINQVNGELGDIDMGPQQQFFIGTSEFNKLKGGAWNFLMSGTKSNVIDHTELRQAKRLNTYSGPVDQLTGKPYLIANSITDFELAIPKITSNVEGAINYEDNDIIKSKNFTIVDPTISVDEINTFLQSGTSVVFSPGIYSYAAPIKVTRKNTVLLGLGLATLVPFNGNEAIIISALGCRIAGLMIQAGSKPATNEPSPTLLIIEGNGDPKNPTILQDVFCRVGGPDLNGECGTMILVNQDHAILENTWTWRADHTDYIRDGLGVDKAKVDHCLVVNANHVTCYCLMIEHTLKELCVWNGDHGRVYFIQSELAYDVGDYDDPWDYPGLRVNGKGFYGAGLGFYSFFSRSHKADENFPVISSAISVKQDAVIDSAMTVLLNPIDGGGVIKNVINNRGQQTDLKAHGVPSWCSHVPSAECKICDEKLVVN